MSFASKIAIPQSLSFIFKKRRLLNRIIILLFALIALSLCFQWNNNLHKPEALARNRVKAMMKHAWSGYYKYARGSDELLPLSQTGYNWTFRSMQFTPVDSMDSLIIMDLMKEYEQAKELVLQYDFDQIDYPINHFETNIRVLGGLLAANDLRPDVRFVKLAEDLGMRLLKAFDTPTGIPLQFIDLKNGSQRKGGSFLACAGTLQLEFQYLSDLTGKTIFQDKALYVLEQLQFMEKPIPGLFPVDIDSDHLRFGAEAYGIAANADSFYEYLLKMYLATGTEKFKTWYEVAANVFSVNKAVVNNLLIKEGKYWYLPDFRFGYHGNEFHHLSCFAGGMFALGAKKIKPSANSTTDYFVVGEKVTETCVKMYQHSTTGLGGETATINGGRVVLSDAKYNQRPETIESIFYMWRFTHDQKYRNYGLEILDKMDKWILDPAGYHDLTGQFLPYDRMESFFLAETLKYLYLLFCDDDVISLDEYVFNTEAHPLSIRGKGRRADSSKWVPIKKTSEYVPPVGSVRPRFAKTVKQQAKI